MAVDAVTSVTPLTPLAMSVLALLAERSMHPYEMYRVMLERRADDLVKVRPGTLYHAVARLADAELVAAVGIDREGGRPERTTYRITPAGHDALQEHIRGLLARPAYEYPSFPVALGEAHNLPREEVLGLLDARVRALEDELARTRSLLAGAAGVDEVYLLDRHYLTHMITAQLEWLRELAIRIDTEELAWPQRTTSPIGS